MKNETLLKYFQVSLVLTYRAAHNNELKNYKIMKKTIKLALFVLIFLVIIPILAGLVITSLWNGIITSVCGFAAITILQAIGIFVLGMVLSVGGFYLGMFIMGAGMHAMGHRHEGMHSHWHNMTDEQRRDFINRRREFFGTHNRQHTGENAKE